MKYILSALAVFFAISSYADNPATYDLKIKITNIKKVKGNIKLGIFNNSTSFLEPGKEYKSITKKVTGNEVTFTLSNLPKGTYAFSLFQDVNSDEKCNLNFIGIPVEPYAFSNNFKPKFSKPDFKDCDIEVTKDELVTIKLIH